MNLLQSSNRCRVFETIASNVWHRTIYNHGVNTSVSEIGITNNIIAEIRNNLKSSPNIGVWANSGYNESKHGCDIDIFIETKKGEYIWWALQAKVLNINGRYSKLDHKSNNEYQWEKLNKLSQKAGCHARYLFYNGKQKFKFNGQDECQYRFDQEQFGCSLIKTNTVEKLALANKITFEDFHPDQAEPWRVIPCCFASRKMSDLTIYFPDQIKESIRYYEATAGNTEMVLYAESSNLSSELPNAINQYSDSINRQPAYRAIVRTTKSLKES